jgi:cytochrome c peroxidase
METGKCKNKVHWVYLIILFIFTPANLFAQIFDYSETPPMQYPENNPWTQEKEALGKLLFFDPLLSGNNLISCGTCHLLKFGWSDNKKKNVGHAGDKMPRNTPGLFDTGYYKSFFLDGRSKSLEQQALGPIKSKKIMGQNLDELIIELNNISEYVQTFKSVFGDQGITVQNIAKALATFERSIVSGTSRFDLYFQNQKSALTPSEIRGMKVFFGKGKCSICHNGPLFSDNLFYNIGVEKGNRENQDLGRFRVTKKEYHKGAFKTTSLRNISKTAPYMHDGSLESLEKVVDFYNRGGEDDKNKSPFIEVIGLNKLERADLINFMKSLDTIISPISNSKESPSGPTPAR